MTRRACSLCRQPSTVRLACSEGGDPLVFVYLCRAHAAAFEHGQLSTIDLVVSAYRNVVRENAA